MIESLVILGIIVTSLLAAYYVKKRETRRYIWVGPGIDPFRRK